MPLPGHQIDCWRGHEVAEVLRGLAADCGSVKGQFLFFVINVSSPVLTAVRPNIVNDYEEGHKDQPHHRLNRSTFRAWYKAFKFYRRAALA